MSNSHIAFPWADGDHSFFLGIDQLEELQRKTDCGPEELYWRICQGRWRVEDLRETLRLGLIGAEMPGMEALLLVRRYCHPPEPLRGSVEPAKLVLFAALMGPSHDAVKKKLAELRGGNTNVDSNQSPTATNAA